eukprot:GILI01018722.1.p2 GENE.GILI01018722.1~~GILI01018722.1.p2  ORF type:complete len:357 (-),score=91.12 GILI01018722.1:65-1135(-)
MLTSSSTASSSSSSYKRVHLIRRPVGLPTADDFRIEQGAVPSAEEVGEGQLLVKVLYVSCDPAMRVWISGQKSYKRPVDIGEVVHAHGVGEVIVSKSPKFKAGDRVSGWLNWQEYAIVDIKGFTKVPNTLPPSAFLGVLGGNGLTAYFGLLDIGKPKAGETVVVSAAAGAVGSIVGQIAKLKGCRVVGIAGSEDKCQWLKTIGFDEAINYKGKNFTQLCQELKQACPKGIDVYFDNVGEEQLDAALRLANERVRVVCCGAISTYNNPSGNAGIKLYPVLISKRGRMEGFIVLDYAKQWGKAVMELAGWLQEGKLQYKEDIVEGIENAPAALAKLFTGQNSGKVLVKVADSPARSRL